jgi:hypothetical protein
MGAGFMATLLLIVHCRHWWKKSGKKFSTWPGGRLSCTAALRSWRRAFLLFLVILASLSAEKLSIDAIEAHKRADAVLFPAFVSACNDYASQHHPDEPGHFDKINKADRERLELANKRWHEFYEAIR